MNIVQLNTHFQSIIQWLTSVGNNISIAEQEEIANELIFISANLDANLIKAKWQKNWELVRQLRIISNASHQSLDEVEASIIRRVVIGNFGDQDVQEMEEIRDKINNAANVEQSFQAFMGFFSIFAKVFSISI